MLRIVWAARSTVCRIASSKLSEDRPDSSMNFTTDNASSLNARTPMVGSGWREDNPTTAVAAGAASPSSACREPAYGRDHGDGGGRGAAHDLQAHQRGAGGC